MSNSSEFIHADIAKDEIESLTEYEQGCAA